MKKLLLILTLSLSLVGCAFLQEQKANFDACRKDPVCYAEAKKWQSTGETLGTVAGSAFPGVASVAGKVGGYVSLGLALLLLGRGLTKKKEGE